MLSRHRDPPPPPPPLPPHPNSVFRKEIKYTMQPLRGINSLRDGRFFFFNYFLSQLYRWAIILYINCGHQGTATNMQDTETAFECALLFCFHFQDYTDSILRSSSTIHFTILDVCQWCSGSANNSPLSNQ